MIQVPELTKALADKMAANVALQLRTSRQYKQPRMKQIAESEDLYFGVVPKSLKNPFNESFPFMSGFVDTLVSKLDDPPEVDIINTDEGDLVSARKYSALFSQISTSPLPNAKWALKDRWCRKLAIFSGVGVYCIYGDNYNDNLNINFETKDYYDFHSEPNGGGDLEQHQFCGEEGIFKTEEQLRDGAKDGYYDEQQVAELLAFNTTVGTKPVQDEYNTRMNRQRALGLDPITNNYIGQKIYKFVQWFYVYQGVRWYMLMEETTGKWIRVKALRDMFPVVPSTGDALYPYVAWHTHEEARVFLSKAPCDDARPMAKTINRLLNQELYNREKKNMGHRLYDPEVITDLESLMDWRPDGLTPFDSKGGTRKPNDSVFTMQTGELSGTVDLVAFLDNYAGQKTATTAGSMGDAPRDQKVGIFYGELQQIEGRLGLYNKSYKEAWAALVYRFIGLVDMYLTQPIAVQMLGAQGIENTELTLADKSRRRDFNIKIKGGNDDMQKEKAKKLEKREVLAGVTSANPKWKDTQLLKTVFDDDEIRHAFDNTPIGTQELMAEAKRAVNDIARGRTPKLNQMANAAFLQKLIDESMEIDDMRVSDRIYDYALAHTKIAAQNEARAAYTEQQARAKAERDMASMNPDGTPIAPAPTDMVPTPTAPTITPSVTA